jgi:hypothetical protein
MLLGGSNMEIWILQITENPAKNRERIIEKLINFLDKEGIPASIKAVFEGNGGIELSRYWFLKELEKDLEMAGE